MNDSLPAEKGSCPDQKSGAHRITRVVTSVEDFLKIIDNTGVLVAIDFGEKRVGYARTTKSRTIVLPIDNETLMKQQQQSVAPRDRFTFLGYLEKAYQVSGVVVGLPLSLRGSYTASTQRAARFARDLAKAFPHLPVLLHDERLSTAEADHRLEACGLSPRDNSGRRDAVAAQIVLESVLAHIDSIRRRLPIRHDDDDGQQTESKL